MLVMHGMGRCPALHTTPVRREVTDDVSEHRKRPLDESKFRYGR
jgi:hypothetical protein